jgi:hypothetical protein
LIGIDSGVGGSYAGKHGSCEAGRLLSREAIRDRSFEGEKMYEGLQTKGEGPGTRDERQWKKEEGSWTMGRVNKVDKV